MAGRPLRRARLNSTLGGNTKSNAQAAQPRVRGSTTYADLMAELRWLGPASVMYLVFTGNTRQCGHSAFMVAQYLIERGFMVSTAAGAGKYCSHFDLAVRTSDRGWVSVDPTAIQFHAPNNESHARDIAEDELNLDLRGVPYAQMKPLIARFFEPTVQWSVNGMLDGTRAFEIADAPGIKKDQTASEPQRPDRTMMGATWRDHWAFYRGLAEDLARGDFTKIDLLGPKARHGGRDYWTEELSRRLRGHKLSA
jgi:hypothetical protein